MIEIGETKIVSINGIPVNENTSIDTNVKTNIDINEIILKRYQVLIKKEDEEEEQFIKELEETKQQLLKHDWERPFKKEIKTRHKKRLIKELRKIGFDVRKGVFSYIGKVIDGELDLFGSIGLLIAIGSLVINILALGGTLIAALHSIIPLIIYLLSALLQYFFWWHMNTIIYIAPPKKYKLLRE